MRPLALLAFGLALWCSSGLCRAEEETGRSFRQQWTQALRAPDPVAIRRLIHESATAEDLKHLRSILSKHLTKMPLLANSKLGAKQVAVYRALLSVGRFYSDRDALEAMGDFVYKQVGMPGADELLSVLVTSNRSPYVIHSLEKIALAPRKPSNARRLSEEQYENLRLFAVERIGTVRTWEAADLLVRVLEAEEKASKKRVTYLMRKVASLLSKLTGRSSGASSVNWAGYLEKNRGGEFPDARESTAAREQTFTAVDDYDRHELFNGEPPPASFVVVVGAHWSKPNSELLRQKGQLEEGEKDEHLLENDTKHRAEYGMTEGLIEDMLEKMGIAFTRINREDLDDHDLSKAGVLIFKCAQFHPLCICRSCPGGSQKAALRRVRCECQLDPEVHVRWTPVMSDKAVKRIEDFVRRGGYVYGEDWTVREVLERTWPKFVTAAKKKPDPGKPRPRAGPDDLTLKEQTIKVNVAAPGHPYARKILNRKMQDIEADPAPAGGGAPTTTKRTYVVRVPDLEDKEGASFEWPVDDESYAATVVDERAVTTLLVSDDIKKQTSGDSPQSGHGSVALTFVPYGQERARKARAATAVRRKGRLKGGAVLWTLGHLATQEGSTEDIYSIEYMILNFINESWSRGVP